MKKMTGNEVRAKFLTYFAGQGHKVVKSSPLLPANDPTLLFINAGMNQFKDVFLGAERRDYRRATTAQKCVRAGGKHNDLDEVGKTARHHTFFEMLGNFSFGDYFKADAIRFAMELLVNEFGMDPARLWFSVFAGDQEVPADEEAIDLWRQAGAAPERILRFGRKDNFWQMGETGPCGPCSEIHYYMGDHAEDPAFNRAEYVNGSGDETIEIWNLVFMQYNRIEEAPGKYRLEPLPAPSIDTGAGLERITAVLQGVVSNYETDLLRPIIDFTAGIAGKPYAYTDAEDHVSMRVIADHARATAFLIADGIFPGNDSRGYVLRKIMRRAIWHGQKLGIRDLFFARVTDFVVGQFGEAYPELRETRAVIERVVTIEEKLYSSTVGAGLAVLDDVMARSNDQRISGSDVFKLYDTFGCRYDLIEYVAGQRGFTLDREGFEAELERQRQRARESMKGAAAKVLRSVYRTVAPLGPVQFTGYQPGDAATRQDGARVLALIRGEEVVERLTAGEKGEVVLDRTPFYAESGGQVGDRGLLLNEEAHLRVVDTQTPTSGLIVHQVEVEQGSLTRGDQVTALVDADRRARTMANHTATHLLHAALREVLGPHVKQAGSLVAPDRLRFDFTHFAPLTDDEMAEIERLVNTQTLRNAPLSKEEKTLDEALSDGAMALFGEKYSDRVRVVSVPGFSTELCGGTHVTATGDIGVFKILSDASVASGTRRIEAVSGQGAYERFQHSESLLAETAARLHTATANLPREVERLQAMVREHQREIERLKLKVAQGGSGAEDQVEEIAGLRLLVRQVEGLGKEGRRQLADRLSRKIAPGIVVLGDLEEGKASLLVMLSGVAAGRIEAGRILRELPGAKGGGKPELAEGGVAPDLLAQTLAEVPQAVRRLLGVG